MKETSITKATKNIVKAMGGEVQSQESESRTGICPDCKNLVSKLAKTCPHCGRPLTSEEIEMNPVEKPWYSRTTEDQRIIAKTSGNVQQNKGGAGVIGIAIAIIIAVIALIILLPKLMSPEVQVVLQEVTK